MTREVVSSDMKEVVVKLIPDSIAKDIEKACQGIYPLHDVYIRKVKILKKPKFDREYFFFLSCICEQAVLGHCFLVSVQMNLPFIGVYSR